MVITYIGGYGFKLSAGDTTVAVNPPSQSSKHKVSKFGADVVLISKEDADWNGEETASHGSRDAFVARGPGAYEVGDVVVNGYASAGVLGKEEKEHGNTMYVVRFDGMKVLILGALSSDKLSQDARSDTDSVDIVFVPVGSDTLEAKKAHELVVSLEPKLIIPYQTGTGSDLKDFLKEEGAEKVKPTEKLTLRAKEVAAMNGEVAVLK